MIAKMLEIFELPSTGDGVFCAGGSQANMYGMILARQLHCPEIKENGAYGLPKLIAYTSDDVSWKFQYHLRMTSNLLNSFISSPTTAF